MTKIYIYIIYSVMMYRLGLVVTFFPMHIFHKLKFLTAKNK